MINENIKAVLGQIRPAGRSLFEVLLKGTNGIVIPVRMTAKEKALFDKIREYYPGYTIDRFYDTVLQPGILTRILKEQQAEEIQQETVFDDTGNPITKDEPAGEPEVDTDAADVKED